MPRILQVLHDLVTSQSYLIISTIRLSKNTDEASLYVVRNESNGEVYVAKVMGYNNLNAELAYYKKLLPSMQEYLPRLPPNPLFRIDAYNGALLMEFIPYSLEKIKNETEIVPEQVLILGKLLLRMLYKLHNANIVHADIKPENILSRHPTITENTNLILIDFEISTPEGTYCFGATPIYCSIAQGRSGGNVTYKADLESVGYILLAFALKIYGRKLPWEEMARYKERMSSKQQVQNELMNSTDSLFSIIGKYFSLLRTIQDKNFLYLQLFSLFNDCYTILNFTQVEAKFQRGEIIQYEFPLQYQNFFQSTIITLIDRNGNKYLSRIRYDPATKNIYPISNAINRNLSSNCYNLLTLNNAKTKLQQGEMLSFSVESNLSDFFEIPIVSFIDKYYRQYLTPASHDPVTNQLH